MAKEQLALQDKAFTSVFWSAIERFSVQGGQIIVELVLARLLFPSDYGIIAMISVFIAIAQAFVDGGFSNALIQKKQCTNIDFSTAFYFNILVGLVLYIVVYVLAPFFAAFYDEPLLKQVTRVVGLNLIVSSLSIVQRSKLIIELNFKRQAFISFASILVSGCLSIFCASIGWGVWALVLQVFVYNTLTTILLWYYGKWKPLFLFSKESFNMMFGYGSKLLISNLLQTIYVNLYTLVIGKRFSSTELGYYNRSSVIAQVPSYKLTEIMTNAMFPIQCQLQENVEQLRRSFIAYLRMACYIVFPLSVSVAVLSDSIIVVVLTEKWLPMSHILSILCFAYMWTPVMAANNNIIKVLGRTDYFLKAEVLKKIIAVLILLVSLPFGIHVICLGLVVYSFVDIFIITYFSDKVIAVSLMEQLKEILKIFLLAISMGGLIFCIKPFIHSCWGQLICGIFIGGCYYICMSRLLKLTELSYIYSHCIQFIKKRR